jgi:hypothetical protein
VTEAPRPQTLGEILDRTVSMYRSGFLVFFGISVIPTGVVLVMALGVFIALAWFGNNGAGGLPPALTGAITIGFVAAVALLALPAALVSTALSEAAVSHAANRTWYGEKVTIRAAYRAAWPRGWRYTGLYLLKSLAVWAPPAAAWFALVLLSAGLALVAAAAGAMAAPVIFLLAVLAVAALVFYCVWMALHLSLAFPACVVEQSTAWRALSRSGSLTRETKGRIFLLYLLGMVLGWMLSGGIVFLAAIASALSPAAHSARHAQAVGMMILFVGYGAGFAVQAFTKPIYGIALVLFYYDQRIRQEGFDIEWMMWRAGMTAPASPQERTPVAAPVELVADAAAIEPTAQPFPLIEAPAVSHTASPQPHAGATGETL